MKSNYETIDEISSDFHKVNCISCTSRSKRNCINCGRELAESGTVELNKFVSNKVN